uniref:Uncharacterized protein n=1 Tax=Anguilla anguilla TaxID=7936 RepID=A0A0E9RAX9_ANGAN
MITLLTLHSQFIYTSQNSHKAVSCTFLYVCSHATFFSVVRRHGSHH